MVTKLLMQGITPSSEHVRAEEDSGEDDQDRNRAESTTLEAGNGS